MLSLAGNNHPKENKIDRSQEWSFFVSSIGIRINKK